MLVSLVIRGTVLYLTVFGLIALSIYSVIFTQDYWSFAWYSVYSGIFGTLLGLVSMGYVLRKYYFRRMGSLKLWLNLHMILGGLCMVIILGHTRMFFRAFLPTMAVITMFIICVSGLYGWFLYRQVCQALKNQKEEICGDEIILLSFAEGSMRYWRAIHRYLTFLLGALLLVHILSVFYFRGAF